MRKQRTFICGSSDDGAEPEGTTYLNTSGPSQNVNVKLTDVSRGFLRGLSPRVLDLLEIAAYVFAADCSFPRGTSWAPDGTEAWRRDLRFVVSVRDPAFWSASATTGLLKRLLGFLSDDSYEFEFQPAVFQTPEQTYISFADFDQWPFVGVPRVMMFSGGLDSLAGALTAAAAGDEMVLVSHRSVATVDARQRVLVGELKKEYPGKVLHVPVWVNKDKRLGKEHTQRTRSFLFVALGCAVAESAQAAGVRFFENGVVSLNLPVAGEALGARASRTTHPLFLQMASVLCEAVLGRNFVLDNPYFLKTKVDVLLAIAEAGGSGLIPLTCSCAHTGFFQSKSQRHCGGCSQCIDRRFAVLAAGLSAFDPATDYLSDVFTGPRSDGYEKNMAVDYALHISELDRMSEEQMSARYSVELARAARPFPDSSLAAQDFVYLHKRHAVAAMRVMSEQIAANATSISAGSLEPSSLVALVAGRQHLRTPWDRYAERIARALKTSLPAMCQSEKPKNEPRLQDLCDGVLKAIDADLTREFPYIRWGTVLTKPDWSGASILVEAKYVRRSSGQVRVSDAIAADLIKYQADGRHILFVVYDPEHCILDEDTFICAVGDTTNASAVVIR
jgi:hypothetical protein